MFACLHWVSNNSVPRPIPGQPYLPPDGVLPDANSVQSAQINATQDSQAPTSTSETQPSNAVNGAGASPPSNLEAATREYNNTLRELAQDLVVKEQQIERIVKEITGLRRSQNDQERRMKELEKEAITLEDQAKDAGETREALIKQVEEVMMRVKRV